MLSEIHKWRCFAMTDHLNQDKASEALVPSSKPEAGGAVTAAVANVLQGTKFSADEQKLCQHCSGSGTCKIGKDGWACGTCMKTVGSTKVGRWLGMAPKPSTTLSGPQWCGVCWGKGFVEGATFKFRNYFPFFFALLIVGASLYIMTTQDRIPEKLTTGLMGLIGTIVGFYFGGKGSH
jgi:hypothetical protein